jgi:penicillin-binding protein 1B
MPRFIHPIRLDLAEMEPRRRRLVIAGLVTAALLFVTCLVGVGFLWKLSRQFPGAPYRQPSRLYAAATRLAPGTAVSPAELVEELEAADYTEVKWPAAVPPGTFRRAEDRILVNLRRFRTSEGWDGNAPAEVRFDGGRVTRLLVAGRPASSVTLEPPLLASYYGPEVEERRPVVLDDLPEPVMRAVLAAEDDSFFLHPGVSPTGIARALWVNLRGGETQQGGSTITQQLVKNVYLSSERTLARKAKEAVISVLVEARYGKRAILEAYLNEIYWGRSGPANLIGFGAAARAYFGKDAAALTLEEAATLAGMIQAPNDYSPVENPAEALARRNWVLQRMGELGWVSPERVRQAVAAPLATSPQRVVPRRLASYFADAMIAEAEERFEIDELDAGGYLLFSTLRWRDQKEAEAAVAKGLTTLGKGWEKGRKGEGPLQAALVSVDPRDGSVLAWVGGRDYGKSQFDRVAQAHRQVGSAFKPVIFAAAFEEAVASPATLLKDSPITVKVGNKSWRPQNYDRGYRGWVTARTALEQSLNIPAVRLSLQVGLHNLADLAADLGISGRFEPVPATALGSLEATPREMAAVYSTFASGGLRPPVHGLGAVLEPDGEPILDDGLPSPRRVLPPHAAYMVTSVLQGALDRGTAAGARGQGVKGRLAGKTGTTNDRRDNWFAGYSPDRVTVVWVGYDDNSRTRLSGARAALPIWSRFTAAVRPPGGYSDFVPPPGIVRATIDPVTGQLATPYCPNQLEDVFPEWQVPGEACRRHMPGYHDQWADATMSQVPIDPATGLPMEGYGYPEYPETGYPESADWNAWGEESSIEITPTGLEAYEPLPGEEEDGLAAAAGGPSIEPLEVTVTRPVLPGAAGAGAPGSPPVEEEGSILIRPRRPEPTPAPAQRQPVKVPWENAPPAEEPAEEGGPPPPALTP